MSALWLNLLTFLAIYSLAIVSPGPNFILVFNTALNDSRRAGLLTACGVATGSGLFGLAGLVGLLLLLDTLPHFAAGVRLFGGGYLAWLGCSMVWSLRQAAPAELALGPAVVARSGARAYLSGLLTNLSNPKAWVFYLSLFTLVISPDLQLGHKLFLNLIMIAISLGWYSLVAMMISSELARPLFLTIKRPLQLVLGVVLVVLGVRIVLL